MQTFVPENGTWTLRSADGRWSDLKEGRSEGVRKGNNMAVNSIFNSKICGLKQMHAYIRTYTCAIHMHIHSPYKLMYTPPPSHALTH